MFSSRSIMNIGIRGATLVSKFVLIFFLAMFFEASDVGLYGLITSSIGYALYAFGFDFYLYSGREIIGSDKNIIGSMIKNQFVLYSFSYVLLSPLFLIVFYKGFIPWRFAPAFFVILILEHIGQELNRILVALSSQLWASVLLFIRSGIWCLLVILMMYMSPASRNLNNLLYFWIFGSGFSCLLGIYVIRKYQFSGWSNAVDWQWIKQGVMTALPYFMTTLVFQALFTVDRYMMKIHFGDQILGSYVLFSSFAFAISTFVDAGVFVFFYPMLIQAHKNENKESFESIFKQMTKNVVFLVTILSVIAVVLIRPILLFTKKAIYLNNITIFYILLFAIWLQVLGWIPQYGLYAKRKDKEIIYSNLLAALLFFPLVFVFMKYFGELGVGITLCIVFLLAFVFKSYALMKAWNVGKYV